MKFLNLPKKIRESIIDAMFKAEDNHDDWEIDVKGSGGYKTQFISYIGQDLSEAMAEIPATYKHTKDGADCVELSVKGLTLDDNNDIIDTECYFTMEFCK